MPLAVEAFHSRTFLSLILPVPHTQHTVPPAVPSNVRVSIPTNTTNSQVQVTWSLTHQHADERAESLTLTLIESSNGTTAQQYQLEGNATQQMVDTVPGMEYWVTVSASNQDGTRTTDPVPFWTSPGCKYTEYSIYQSVYNLDTNPHTQAVRS